MTARTAADCVAEAKALVERLDGFTPGPWNVNGPKEMEIVGRVHRILSRGNYPAAFVPAWDRPEAGQVDGTDEAIANADLTAAAPDMHRIIRDLLAVIEKQREALRQIAAWDWHEIEPNGADIPENVEPWARELDDACTHMQRIARAALGEKP